MTIADVRWFSVYDTKNQRDLGHVIIPDGINVPPSLSQVVELESSMDNCQMLHSDLAVGWTLFPPSLTLELIGNYFGN